MQNEFNVKRSALNRYFPKNKKYIEAKNTLLDNAKNFYEETEKIVKGFKEAIFLLKSGDKSKKQQSSKKFNEKESPKKKKKKFM